MKTSSLIMILLLAVVCSLPAGDQAFRIVELPRPNSGTFSFQQAESRKSEILSNAATSKLERPDMGLCIHIEKDDSITLYNHFLKALPDYSQPRTNQSVAQIEKMVDAIPRAGNPVRILITSDVPLKNSKTIHEVLKALFVPSVQLFYARSSEQDGAANGSQPIRSETNRTSSAAGSRR